MNYYSEASRAAQARWNRESRERQDYRAFFLAEQKRKDAAKIARIRSENPDHLQGADWLYWPLRLYFAIVRW
jgi:hypothetical protein